ncbi:LytR/AlgR family response regulator transcription factor [Flavobacterium selenitireducens]|uniref:LytR/AlgR family response regulator transcription factor n=1 Tax=Flavobacterium selenitireducens TaxID=2722704 RepID=UPI00168BFB7E|nr:LytTR family DNA-binding domain-containing protein [Flavobacterium selenitireducens]MBD3581330.1 response regulator transcription factor [Flavobacterium selenitireducens]
MNCIIVDDEPLAREGMLLLLGEIDALSVAGSFGSAKKALDFIRENTVDLVFLDIQMPGLTGLELAGMIPEETLVIFTTAFSEYALESYDVDAVDYIVKPILKERLEKAVKKAFSYHELLVGKDSKTTVESASEEFILVKSDRKFHKIAFDDIRFVEGLKDYVVIHCRSGKLITAMNLRTISRLLPPGDFVRVSKSYIVNTKHITAFDNHSVNLETVEVPIGEVYRKEFLKLYLGNNNTLL